MKNNNVEIPFEAKGSKLDCFEYTIPNGYEAEIKDGKVIVRKAESEDEKNERIRLGLIEVLKTVPSGIFEDRGKITLDEGFYWLERKEYEKQGEQKLVEWSEEDEKMRESIRLTLIGCADSQGAPNLYGKQINWLKSIKDRVLPQPKAEWSEEDEKTIEEAIEYLERYAKKYMQGGNSKQYVFGIASRLDHLRSQKK